MNIQDRINEHAGLQAIGVRLLRAMRLVLAEIAILCLAGGIAGTEFALATLGLGAFAMGAERVTIAFRRSLGLKITRIIVSLFVAVAAGFTPGLQVAVVPIVDSLRQA